MTKAAELAKMGEVLTNSQIGGRRNIVINGAMQVAQRGTSFSLSGTADTFITDRFLISNSDTGAWTASQSTDSPTGFSNSLKMDCTTADTSPTFLTLMTRFEGQDLQHLKKGTSSAEKTTLSFFVKSNKTGTYIAELRDIDNNRTIGKAYTISSADTWEQKIITFDGDTTGAFGNDNGNSLQIIWYLAVGSVYNSGTLATSWGSRVNANTAVGQVNLADSTDNEWYITGIQLEVGSQATPFEHRSFGEEQRLCQRYAIVYSKNGQPNMGQKAIGTGASTNNSGAYQAFIFPQVTMRAVPTLTVGGSVSDYEILKYETGFVDLNSSISLYSASGRSLFVLAISSATAEAERGRDVIMRLEGDNSSLLFDSEL